MAALHVGDDCLVHSVAGHTHRLFDHDAVHGDNGGLRAPAADVDDHVSACSTDGQLRADCSRKRLRHEVGGTTRAGLLRRVTHGTLLDAGYTCRDADHYLGPDQVEPADDLADEVAQH